jgi:hypothetical protein
MRIGRRNRSTRRKPTPVPFYPPQIPHDLTGDITWVAALGSPRLATWSVAWSLCSRVLLKMQMFRKPVLAPSSSERRLSTMLGPEKCLSGAGSRRRVMPKVLGTTSSKIFRNNNIWLVLNTMEVFTLSVGSRLRNRTQPLVVRVTLIVIRSNLFYP